MKKYMPFNGLRWSRDSGSALYDIPQTAVFGRAGGVMHLKPVKNQVIAFLEHKNFIFRKIICNFAAI